MKNLKPVWIDTDTGVDDAFALITAFQLKNIEIKGISVVCGNVEVEKTFRNARNIVSLVNHSEVKVYKGASHPMIVDLHPAYNVHGVDGLGGAKIKESKAPIETKNAVEALYECAKEIKNLYVVAVGPLTNIALTIINHPDFLDYVAEIDIMGGSLGVGGNTTPSAEFNIYSDPHAAQTVFMSGAKINLFPLDVTMKSTLSKKDVEYIGTFNNEVSDFLKYSASFPMNLYNSLGLGEILCLHDTCPLAFLEDPTIFKGKLAGVYVETQSQMSLGRTINDVYVKSDDKLKKNAFVYLDVDNERLANLVIEGYKKY